MSAVKGFVTHPTYRIVDEKTYVHLFGKLENGESFLVINEYRPYFYIRKEDAEKAQAQATGEVAFDIEPSKKITSDGKPAVKVSVAIPKHVPHLRREWEGIPCYEADIRFAYRYMIDFDICGSITIEGTFEKGESVDREYREAQVSSGGDVSVSLKVASVDIETSRNGSQLFSIGIVCDEYKECFIVSKIENLKHARSFATEKEMLEAFKQKLIELDPDIITGWHVIDFDFDCLQRKYKEHKIPFTIGRTDFDVRITKYETFFRESSAMIAGRMVLDGIALLKNNFVKLEDYKLQTAASEILGESKLITATDRCAEIERQWKEEPQKLVDYNIKDCELVLRILDAKNLIDITMQRSLLTGMAMDRVSASIASLDSLYLRETKKKDIVCMTMNVTDRDERITGGYVLEPESGIYDYVLVVDFKSLYPSVIRTFNIDPLSYDPAGTIVAPNGARFRDEDGILPLLIQKLWSQRDVAKKNKDSVASHAIKITMNSFFGVLANPTCRFYSIDVANAITFFGRDLIQRTQKLLSEKGYKVIYGDTDSLFIDVQAKSLDEANAIGKEIETTVNAHFTKHIKKEFKRTSYLELEYEKCFIRFILPRVRHGEGGAKKRYAGLVMKDGKEEISFTGLEFVRRDWTELAKEFQLTLLDKVFHRQEVGEYVKQFIKDLKAGKLDELLVYKKAIRKPLHEYTKTTPPHVKAARMLPKLDSRVIHYYMTTNGPEPESMLKSAIDYDHYIEKQLKPIADSILVFFNLQFDDLAKGSSQKTLFGY